METRVIGFTELRKDEDDEVKIKLKNRPKMITFPSFPSFLTHIDKF